MIAEFREAAIIQWRSHGDQPFKSRPHCHLSSTLNVTVIKPLTYLRNVLICSRRTQRFFSGMSVLASKPGSLTVRENRAKNELRTPNSTLSQIITTRLHEIKYSVKRFRKTVSTFARHSFDQRGTNVGQMANKKLDKVFQHDPTFSENKFKQTSYGSRAEV